MIEFVLVERKGIKGTALVPKKSLEHYRKAGWTPVEKPADKAAADKKES